MKLFNRVWKRLLSQESKESIEILTNHGFSQEESLGISKLVSEAVSEYTIQSKRQIALESDFEEFMKKSQVDFQKLRMEVRNLSVLDYGALKLELKRIEANVGKLEAEIMEEIQKSKGGFQLDLNLNKGRILDETLLLENKLNSAHVKICEQVDFLEKRVSKIKSEIDSVFKAAFSPKISFKNSSFPPSNRNKTRVFSSPAVDEKIEKVQSLLKNDFRSKALAILFENCWPNTLDSTVIFTNFSNPLDLDAFVITGDIHAMWLRDSTNQIAPFVSLLHSERILQLFLAVLKRQAKSILLYPYGNAFSFDDNYSSYDNVVPPPPASVFEDSLAAFLKLSNLIYKNSKDKAAILSFLNDTIWINAVKAVISTAKDQQAGTMEEFKNPKYTFSRSGAIPSDTLILGGIGAPAKRCGLVKSHFRPSDDSSTLPFLVPANAMFSVELRTLSKLLKEFKIHLDVANEALALSDEIHQAIQKHALVNHPVFGKIYAYEVDGFGGSYLMDDANIPSLLSLPYLGYVSKTDPTYLRTRAFVLSDFNPYYFSGQAAEGIGGPHCGLGYIWPMSIIMRGITSTSKREMEYCFDMLIATHADTGLMHESFWKDDASIFTRSWFAWANSLFGEFVLNYIE